MGEGRESKHKKGSSMGPDLIQGGCFLGMRDASEIKIIVGEGGISAE